MYSSGISEEMERGPQGTAVLGHVDTGRSGQCSLPGRIQNLAGFLSSVNFHAMV